VNQFCISQGSAVTFFRCGGLAEKNHNDMTNFAEIPYTKNIFKKIGSFLTSYLQKKLKVSFFCL